MSIDYHQNQVKTFLLYLWQLPQVLLALSFLCLRWPRSSFQVKNIQLHWIHFPSGFGFAFSLGPYIFAPSKTDAETLKHEAGHSIQSLYLGPFYLLCVGLPSLSLYWYCHFRGLGLDYYLSRYPEAWANQLSGAFSEDSQANESPKD